LAFKLKFLAGVLLLLVGTAGISRAEQADQVPAKELVQYIRDAQKQGIAEVKIKQQALAVGWASAAVDAALEYAKSASPTGQAVSNPPEEVTIAARPAAVPDKIAATMPGNPVLHGSSDDYLIGSGDTLQIAIWKEPEASVPSVVVRPDGRITIPLIKEVEVAGLTPRQAEATITAGMGKFINDPNVTVVVAAINSKKVYMIGAVKKEGTLPYTYGMTVMQALSEAGGLTDYAKRKKIYILRSEKGREYRLDFNYEEVIKGERMDQNAVLLPGDTVVIPQ